MIRRYVTVGHWVLSAGQQPGVRRGAGCCSHLSVECPLVSARPRCGVWVVSADSQCQHQQCQQSGPGHGQGESPAADRQHEAPVPHGALASLQIHSGVSFNKSSNIIVTKKRYRQLSLSRYSKELSYHLIIHISPPHPYQHQKVH